MRRGLTSEPAKLEPIVMNELVMDYAKFCIVGSHSNAIINPSTFSLKDVSPNDLTNFLQLANKAAKH